MTDHTPMKHPHVIVDEEINDHGGRYTVVRTADYDYTVVGEGGCDGEEIAHVWNCHDDLVALVREAATDSVVTGGEHGGPGCFYCDTEEGHAPDCVAAEALKRARGEE